ncbi:type IV pilus assembly protein PilX [Chromohalobacter marismortui]|uniref:Type IV pilus assembly protein PilX n=1 Tax=Chromohalobacter marismortui TaxID=42055 RepID=A0A4R7NFP1_9GAMM|nr:MULTISPECIES: PilX N-terminal domain-containing pilus assembly protein [Chromohalobacter]MCI0511120.1 PilX N-terminal domain-containing pilus assembly protein [Chromohalobacter sp.]MCI0593224.1 PilX N-terminal domain-containing pilus assembly protein [Chromohalobacter sp.]TDU19147.1 type IV pilus assembly protein PilX [Chromohalobacter marismortui]
MTLVVALILLMAMTALGVAGLQGAVLQERMARNVMDRQVAFQAAQAALEEGEWRLRHADYTLPAAQGGCTAPDCLRPSASHASQWSAAHWRREGLAYGDSGAPPLAGGSEPPRVTLAVRASVCPKTGAFCRVRVEMTAFGWGARSVTHAILERCVTLMLPRAAGEALIQARRALADNDDARVIHPLKGPSRPAWREVLR